MLLKHNINKTVPKLHPFIKLQKEHHPNRELIHFTLIHDII